MLINFGQFIHEIFENRLLTLSKNNCVKLTKIWLIWNIIIVHIYTEIRRMKWTQKVTQNLLLLFPFLLMFVTAMWSLLSNLYKSFRTLKLLSVRVLNSASSIRQRLDHFKFLARQFAQAMESFKRVFCSTILIFAIYSVNGSPVQEFGKGMSAFANDLYLVSHMPKHMRLISILISNLCF